jgi:uncharacterized protein (TIGR03084 family)
MDVLDDLEAEHLGLEAILDLLDDEQWAVPSAAQGWSVADVVLHLAQTDEAVVASCAGEPQLSVEGVSTDELVERWVQADRAPGAVVYPRWRAGWRAALAALRGADQNRRYPWAATPLRPQVLATTRIAEHWAHGLDITEPLGIAFPDSDRLRHVAWLGHRTLPYALSLTGQPPLPVRCELTAPDGSLWRLGEPDAPTLVTGTAGAFCRVGAQRLAPADSGLTVAGPGAGIVLPALRNYAA